MRVEADGVPRHTRSMATGRDEILAAARDRLRAALGARLKGLILFGSEARGDAAPDSDIDLLVLLDTERDRDAGDRIHAALRDLDMEYQDRFFGPIVVPASRFETQAWSLDRNALREGLVLWVEDEAMIWRARENAKVLPAVSPEVDPLWRQACKALDAARRNLEINTNTSANRAYYAAFYAVSALLAVDHRHFSKHAAVQAAVHRELVKPGLWPENLGEAYDTLYENRHEADYIAMDFPELRARLSICCAERILDEIREMRPGEFGEDS